MYNVRNSQKTQLFMGLFPKMIVYLPADISILSNIVYFRSKQPILVQYSLSPRLKLSSHLKKAVTELVFLFSIFISLSIFLGNSNFVYANPEPFISIILSPDSISFHADTSPGTFDSQSVDVTVHSDHKDWSIHCEVITPLKLSGRTNRIPFERLFINTPYTDPAVDKGAGPGYESMDQPRLVAKSSLTSAMAIKARPLKFRLLTTWKDKPGTYVGQIRFTYLTNP